MKRHFRNRQGLSFTLVELLVVMGIIAILAGVLLEAGNRALQAASRAKAQAMTGQIQVACMSYYNDYGVYPVATNASYTTNTYYGTGDVSDWSQLIYALCGNINPVSPGSAGPSPQYVPNNRAIAYLTLNRSSIDTANYGIPLNPIAPTMPSYFNICMDATYSGIISNVPIVSGSTLTTNNMTGGVYVFANCNPSSTYTNAGWWVHTP